jgi:hypothetical protein
MINTNLMLNIDSADVMRSRLGIRPAAAVASLFATAAATPAAAAARTLARFSATKSLL